MGGTRPPRRRYLPYQVVVFAIVVAVLVAPRPSPGTVAEQRARLPPPAECLDPVEGVWQSHAYYEHLGSWAIFTCEIHWVEGSDTALEGRITNESWYADPAAVEPPPCGGELHYLVSMTAAGRSDGDAIEFGGVDWTLQEVLCGDFWGGYNLDVFSGRIDHELQEFQSVNNDGGVMVDYPTVFRRIRCFDEPPDPTVTVVPPALYPDSHEGGCSR